MSLQEQRLHRGLAFGGIRKADRRRSTPRLLAKEYAPELELAGVAVAAPATDLGALMRDDLPTPGGKNLLAMTLWSWSRVFNISLENVVDPAAMPTINALANVCLDSPIDLEPRRRAGAALQKRFLLVHNLTELEPWRTLLAENTIGPLPPSIPVFIAQGSADKTVDPPVTQAYMKELCAAGSRVRMLILPGVGHGDHRHEKRLKSRRLDGQPLRRVSRRK